MFFIKRHKLQTGFIVVCEYLAFGSFNALSDFEEKLIDIIFVLLRCFFVQWIGDFIFFYINEDEPNAFNDCENKVLTSIVPLFLNLGPKIEQSSLEINHRVPNLAYEIDFWRSSWEVIKSDFELVFRIFIEPISHKHNTMPDYIKRKIYFRGYWAEA